MSLWRLSLSVVFMSRTRFSQPRKRGKCRVDQESKSFVQVYAKLLWSAIYCANIRPEFPFRIPVLQGTGETRSACHIGLRSCNRDFKTTINAASHVWIGFLNFCCHELTQIREYDWGILSKHAINIDNKQEKNVHIACVNAYRACPSLLFSANPGVFVFFTSCMIHSLGPPVWRQLWPHSDFPVIPWWGRHLLYSIQPSPEIPPPLISCDPGVLGFFRVHSEGIKLAIQGIEDIVLHIIMICN